MQWWIRRLRKISYPAHGRGIYLMKVLMDEVSFEEGGTVVHMRKKPNAGTSDSITSHCDPTNEDVRL